MKKTAIAPTNIAFIKYWGRKDDLLRLPINGSISMNLSNMKTTTTVEFSDVHDKDTVRINEVSSEKEQRRVIKHLDRIRKQANVSQKAKVVSQTSFPIGTGLSSSASGFAALTVAAASAAGLDLTEKELSVLSRQGSGSSCRSIPDGFVEWNNGDTSETSFAESIFPENYWDLVDVVAVVSTGRKDVATSVGHTYARTSPFYETRLSQMAVKIEEMKHAIDMKDFESFGTMLEAEALNMHAIMLTSTPSLIYWTPGTLELMKLVKNWRNDGLESYFTINTGQDIHILVQKENERQLSMKLKQLPFIKDVIFNKPSKGTRLTNKHLF